MNYSDDEFEEDEFFSNYGFGDDEYLSDDELFDSIDESFDDDDEEEEF